MRPPNASTLNAFALAAAFLANTASATPPLTITPIVIEGQNVPGVGNIPSGFSASENMAVNNSGQWLVESDTDNPDTNTDGVLMKGMGHAPGGLYLREGQNLAAPAGANLDTFDAITINNGGNSGFNFFLGNTGSASTDSGVYYNTTMQIQESNISTAPEFSPNTPYIGWFEVKINNNDHLMMVSSVDDPAIASTVDRALVRLNVGTGAQSVITKEGDNYFGFAASDFGTGPHSSAFNDSGHTLYSVDTADPNTATDGAVCLHNGLVASTLAREGTASGVVAARNWGTLIDTAIDLNNNGDWVMRGDLDGATSDDSLIVKNGNIILAREGFGLTAIGAFFFESFGTGAVQISDNGDVFWLGDWNDPDTSRDRGLFMNDMLLVQEGVTAIDGSTLASISNVQDNFQTSDNGQWLVFEGTLADGRDGAFLIEIPEPSAGILLLLGLGLGCIRRRR